jgi:hypothetical protein
MVYGIWLLENFLMVILVYVFGICLRYILGTWLRQVVDELAHIRCIVDDVGTS